MASKPRFASGYDLNNASVLAQIAAGNFGNAKTIFAIFDEAEVRHIFQQYMSGNRGALVLLQTVYPAAVVAQQGNQVYLEESVVETLKRRQVNYRARANVVINGVQVPFVQAGTKVEEWVWVDALHQNDTLDETTCRTLNLDFAPLLSDAMFERYVFLALVAVSGKVDVNNAITVFPIVMALATDFGYQQYRQMMPETTAKLEDLKRRPEGLPTMKVKPGERPNLPWGTTPQQTPAPGRITYTRAYDLYEVINNNLGTDDLTDLVSAYDSRCRPRHDRAESSLPFGSGKRSVALAFTQFVERRGQLDELAALIAEKYPHLCH